jgi:hypothetical protein
MTRSTHRVTRTDHAGQPMAALDFTSKADAKACRDSAVRSGTESELQTFDPMTGEFVTVEEH